jgi:hypothetical protein
MLHHHVIFRLVHTTPPREFMLGSLIYALLLRQPRHFSQFPHAFSPIPPVFLHCTFFFLSLLHTLIFCFEFPVPRHKALALGGSWCMNLYIQFNIELISPVDIMTIIPQLPSWLKIVLLFLCPESMDEQSLCNINKWELSYLIVSRPGYVLDICF